MKIVFCLVVSFLNLAVFSMDYNEKKQLLGGKDIDFQLINAVGYLYDLNFWGGEIHDLDFTEVQKLLDQGADTNAPGEGGMGSAFGVACKFGHTELVKFFIDGKYADINRPHWYWFDGTHIKEKKLLSPLALAVIHNREKIVKLLMLGGASFAYGDPEEVKELFKIHQEEIFKKAVQRGRNQEHDEKCLIS